MTSAAMLPRPLRDITEGLEVAMPDSVASLRLLRQFVAEKERHEREKAARQQRRERAVEQPAAPSPMGVASSAAVAEMAALHEELKLSGSMEDYLEGEQVLFGAQPAEPPLALDEEFEAAAAAAAAELGLLAAACTAEDAFRQAVLSGLVRTQALRRGECSAATVRSLLALLSSSPAADLAGASFATLLAVMGDPQLPHLQLDSVYAAPALPRGPLRLDYIPKDTEILEALKANGYDPARAAQGRIAMQGRGAGAAGQAEGEGEDEGEGRNGRGEERVQAVKLLLHTAAAVCRYAAAHPGSPAAAAAVSREGLAELLLAVLRLGLDPCALRLHADLEAAGEAVLGAFGDEEWGRELPRLAGRAATLGPSTRARLRLLRQLPAASARGFALQQLAGCLLVERMVPANGPPRSAVARRAEAPDPAAVISSQPWFGNAKELVGGASRGAGPRCTGGGGGAYTIDDVELLLRACDLLLWPHMLRAWQGADGPLTPVFLDSWLSFLKGVEHNIKAMEDRAVKTLASHLGIVYDSMRSGEGVGSADAHLASP